MAERRDRTLINLTKAMLIESGAPLNLWGEAILTACHVLNRMPHKKSKLTPFELWATTCAFLGYAINSTIYRFLDIENNVIFESSDVIFHEENFPFKSKNSGGKEVRENVLSRPSSFTPHSQNQENLEIELRKSKRVRVEKDFDPNYYVFNVDENPLTLKEALL